MAAALRRLPLEWALLLTLPGTIVAVACSASWSVGLRGIAHPVRAIGLVTVAALAVALAATRLPLRLDRAVAACAAAFLAIAGVSTTWSVDAGHTLARTAGLALVILAAAALASAYADDEQGRRRLLLAILAGAVIVAALGVAIAAASPDSAVQAATASTGERFRGVGQNPNTVSMLFAAALPIAALWLAEARSWARTAAVGAFALLGGSIIASASRGAAAAACIGVVVFLAGYQSRRARVALAAGVAALALASVAVAGVSAPLSPAEAARVAREHKYPVGSTERRTPNDAQFIVRLEDEIDYSAGTPAGRSRVSSSGRVEAWRGALHQIDDRPVAGYGFGTEETVFVDRFQSFQGGVPENSFLGFLLQIGAVGLAAFVALVAALAAAAFAFFRRDRPVAVTSLGILAAGLALASVQSYIYVVGNTATLVVWIGAFLSASRPR